MTQRILGSQPTTEELLEHCEYLLKTEKMTGPQIELIQNLIDGRKGRYFGITLHESRSRLLEIVGLYR